MFEKKYFEIPPHMVTWSNFQVVLTNYLKFVSMIGKLKSWAFAYRILFLSFFNVNLEMKGPTNFPPYTKLTKHSHPINQFQKNVSRWLVR
jgi:hypothetical protein